ncbi:hypothetical protein GC175_30445 [bacterium]|nr:hypothetical protein [bacterium]
MSETPESGTTTEESLKTFASSFSYGSRTDLNFKFLSKFSEEEVAQFFQELLWKLGYAADSGDYSPVAQHVFDWQVRGYAPVKGWTYDEGPFTPFTRNLSDAKLTLLTSSGHFVAGDDPRPFGIEKMTQAKAIDRIDDFLREAPTLSEIPFNTPKSELRVRHGGYDICAAQQDANVALPIELLRELVAEGRLGSLTSAAYSFVGACAQTPLVKKTAPEWAQRLQADGAEAALLVPV